MDSQTTTYALDLNTGLTQVLQDGTYTYLYGNERISQESTAPEYFLGDALGSVRQMAGQTGTIVYAASYSPYGEVLAEAGTSPTSYGYTNEYTSQGLIYLRSRMYSPATGHFLTKDSWQGDYNRPASFNDWGYVEGNPIRYIDPYGYATCEKIVHPSWCVSVLDDTPITRTYHFPLAEFVTDGDAKITLLEGGIIEHALDEIARAYRRGLDDYLISHPCMNSIERLILSSIDANSIFVRIHHGRITIHKRDTVYSDEYPNTWGSGAGSNAFNIWTEGDFFGQYDSALTHNGDYGLAFAGRYYKNFIIHEMGHVFDVATGSHARSDVPLDLMTGGTGIPNGFYLMKNDLSGEQWQFRDSEDNYEYFADMFLGWVEEKWELEPGTMDLTDLGNDRKNFMDETMAKWIYDMVGLKWLWH